MKAGWLFWLLGILSAAMMHGLFLLFGGIFFLDDEKDEASLQAVDLLSDLEAEDERDEEEPEKTSDEEEAEELQAETEEPPDAAEILRDLETPQPVNLTPALEAASLSAIEAALSGQGGGGDFAEALTFASGGQIGGTGKPGESSDWMEEAFSLAEIDQKPQVLYQESPVYPREMRGKDVEGVVTVIFVVDAGGKVQGPKVEKSSHAAFEPPALSAIKKWKFEPGVRAGQRVASKMRISIRFPQG